MLFLRLGVGSLLSPQLKMTTAVMDIVAATKPSINRIPVMCDVESAPYERSPSTKISNLAILSSSAF
ncbi:unnamed protein product [Musa hybrid cultivar]